MTTWSSDIMVNIVSMQISLNKLIQTATLRIYRAQLLETPRFSTEAALSAQKLRTKSQNAVRPVFKRSRAWSNSHFENESCGICTFKFLFGVRKWPLTCKFIFLFRDYFPVIWFYIRLLRKMVPLHTNPHGPVINPDGTHYESHKYFIINIWIVHTLMLVIVLTMFQINSTIWWP